MTSAIINPWPELPGSDLITQGLDDLGAHKKTVCALLVRIAEPALRSFGIDIPQHDVQTDKLPEHQLFEMLLLEDPQDAHRRYNALIRSVVSFQHAFQVKFLNQNPHSIHPPPMTCSPR